MAIVLAAILAGSTIAYLEMTKSSPRPTSTDFVFTKEEIDQLKKWKDKPLEELFTGAFQGDAAALYAIGQSFLEGGTNDVQIAAHSTALAYFAASGSLGYAPALEKIRSYYIHEKKNPFLALVYEHLIVLLSHPEVLTSYHSLKNDLPKERQSIVSREVDEIAALKHRAILRNLDMLQTADDKNSYISLFCLSGGIMNDDPLLANLDQRKE